MNRADAPISSDSLKRVDASELSPSDFHVRGRTPVTDEFVRSVQETGIVQPPLVREEGNGYGILDGVRRVVAARKAGEESVSVLVTDVDDTDALAVSLGANIRLWRKSVSETDEQRALMQVVTGERRTPSSVPWSDDDRKVLDAKYRLGLVSEVDMLAFEIGDVSGVGGVTIARLIEEFGDAESVGHASTDELMQVKGIGEAIAMRIQQSFSE